MKKVFASLVLASLVSSVAMAGVAEGVRSNLARAGATAADNAVGITVGVAATALVVGAVWARKNPEGRVARGFRWVPGAGYVIPTAGAALANADASLVDGGDADATRDAGSDSGSDI